MNKRLVEYATLGLINIVCFFGLKSYNDNHQVRLVSALLPKVVKVQPVGPLYKYEPYAISFFEIGFKKHKVGFGVMGHGSGVYLDSDGLIVTCAHVVEGTSLAEISVEADKPTLYPKRYKTAGKVLAYVVGRDREHDVALLRLVNPPWYVGSVSIAKSVRKGMPVLTIGFPGPFHKYVTAGIISGSMGGDIYSDLTIAPGNSGGGVFNVNGELVGLARFMTGPVDVPISQGFSGLTSLRVIRALVEKYRGF